MRCIIKVRTPEEWKGVMYSVNNRSRVIPFQQRFPYYLAIEKGENNKLQIYSSQSIEAFGDGAQFILYNYYIANKEKILFDILL